MSSLARLVIRFYQVALAPMFGGACRHVPSCSEYARLAIERHGIRRGVALAVKRLARCLPLGSSGFDTVQ